MNIPHDIDERFFSGLRTDTVRFVMNDPVRVRSGRHAGRTGAVVSIVSLRPEATFLVEIGRAPFGDLEIRQSDLELIE